MRRLPVGSKLVPLMIYSQDDEVDLHAGSPAADVAVLRARRPLQVAGAADLALVRDVVVWRLQVLLHVGLGDKARVADAGSEKKSKAYNDAGRPCVPASLQDPTNLTRQFRCVVEHPQSTLRTYCQSPGVWTL